LSARADLSNKLALTEASLHTAEANLDKAATEAKAQVDSNAVALAQRDQKISELETENQALDKEASSLRVSMTNLDNRIAATQAKLARSEGDREFLLRQLKILKAEKAEMEQKFNSLTAVREQLRKLKTEASIDRRLERQRRRIDATFEAKAGENLTEPAIVAPPPEGSGASVELRQRGGVKIEIPPSTNAPPK
jgi:chromosome segregation ATPase